MTTLKVGIADNGEEPHQFNKRSKTKELKPVEEVVSVPVPPLIDVEPFGARVMVK